jgi:translocation and assembly module TamB
VSAPPDSSGSAPPAEGPSRLRRWGRRAALAVGGLAAALLLLVGALLLGLQTETGSTAAARWLAQTANPLPGTQLSVGRAAGTWWGGLRLTNVTLTRPDSSTGRPVQMAHVDTLSARYRLLPLLQNRLHLTSVAVDGPSVTARQAADSSWDWGRLLAADPAAAEAPDTSAGLAVQVDRLRLSGGAVTAAFYAGGRDSTARVRALDLRARALAIDTATTVRLDTLGLAAQLPGRAPDLTMTARGALTPAAARLDTFRLDSPRSRVWGGGRVPRTPAAGDRGALRLRAAPLALADLTPLLPGLAVDPAETVRLDLRLGGTPDRLTARADARFSGGGTLTATGAATPRTTGGPGQGPLQYRLDARLRQLTTSLLGPPDAAQNRLSATLSADLQGPALTALDGPVALRLSDTRWGPLRADTLTLDAPLRDGTAALALAGTLNGARLEGRGEVRPFDAAPDAALTARLRGFDVGAVAPAAGLDTDLAGTVALQARALGAPAQTLDLSLALAPSRIGRQPVEAGSVRVAVRPDRAELTGRLQGPVGTVEATAFAALDGSERFGVTPLRLERLDLAALTGDSTASRVTGTVRVTGQGFAPETMTADATVELRDSRYGPYRLSALSTRGRLAGGRLTATTDATLNGGRWQLAAEGRPLAAAPTVELTRGRFTDVDLGPFLQDTTQSSRLQGTLSGRVRGVDPATMTADAALTLDSSRVNRQALHGGRLALRLESGRLDAEMGLDTPSGGARLQATARPFDAVPTVRVPEGTIDRLDVGALAGVPGLATQLSGTLALEGRGGTAETLSLDGRLSLADSRVNDAALPAGSLSVAGTQGRVRADGAFEVAGGRVALATRLDSLDATPTYTARTHVDSVDLGALAGTDSLTARVDTLLWTVDGRGTDPATLTATTRLAAAGVHVDRHTVDAVDLAGTFRAGRLAVDTVGVRSDALVAVGSGTIAVTDSSARTDFGVEAIITDAAPLRRLVGAQRLRLKTGRLEARLYGSSIDEQRFDGEVTLTSLLYDDLRLAEATVTFNGRRGGPQLVERWSADGTLGYLSLPSVSVAETDFDARYDGTGTALSAQVRLDPARRAAVDAYVQADAARTTVTLRSLTLGLAGDRWSLLQEATLTAGAQYRIDGLLLHTGAQQVAVDGVVDPQGTQSLVATVENVRLGAVSPLAGLSGLDGTLSGSVELSGPAASPRLDSRLSLALRSEQADVGTLQLDADYADLALRLDATLTHASGRVLTATGTVPTDLRLRAPTPVDVADRPVRLDLSTEAFPVNWVDPFLDPASVRDVGGTLSADVAVRGTLADPDLDGQARLADGGAALPALSTRYRDAAATLRFDDDQVALEEAVVRSSNDGRLRASGVINFPQLTVGEYDLQLEASDFIAIDTRAYRRAVVDGAMTLRGTTARPVLTGQVAVRSGDIFYNEALAETEGTASAVPLTDEDQLTLENRFGIRLSAADTTTFDAYEALEMDLTVQIRRNTWLRSKSTPEMNIQFTGDLDVSKAPDADAQVFGSIEVVTERSTLRQFGQEFQITQGTLTFNGDPTTPYLALEAVYEQRARGTQGTEVRITLGLEGRPDGLTPTLSSEPTMDTRNILSYLATGRPADELLSGGGEGSGNLATQVALGQASNFVENLAASELGLDVVRVQLRTSGASYLTVGRYFTPRFFVSIEQPVATSNLESMQSTQYLPDLTLEYQLLDTLLLRVLNNQQSLQLNLLFEYAY